MAASSKYTFDHTQPRSLELDLSKREQKELYPPVSKQRGLNQHDLFQQKGTQTLLISDEVSASLGLEFCQDNIASENIEQGAVLSLRQQGDSDGGPPRPQLRAIRGIKVLQGQPGGGVLGKSSSLLRRTIVIVLQCFEK